MSNEKSNTFEHLQAKMNEKLQKAKQEIEELSVQFSLGKAEASDKFEQMKKDFHTKVNEWKISSGELSSSVKEKSSELKSKIEGLQVQLALGKAEAKDLFHDQKKKIMQSIAELEAELKKKA